MNISIDNLPNDINLLKQIIVDFQRENLYWQEKYQILLGRVESLPPKTLWAQRRASFPVG
nr:hypothetical protein [Arsenophonus endosymbiont of Aleurodicus floccissimus]